MPKLMLPGTVCPTLPRANEIDASAGIVTTIEMRLDFKSAGRLNCWMGPALRGVIAKRLKDLWCHWEDSIRDDRYKHCRGCTYQTDCRFAKLLEPAQMRTVVKGWQALPHRLVIAPEFPVRTYVRGNGTDAPLAIRILVYEASEEWFTPIISALTEAGKTVGLGNDGVQFAVTALRQSSTTRLHDRLLNVLRSSMDHLETVRVTAQTPTILKRDGELVVQPHFFDFFSASLRLIRALLGESHPLATVFSDTEVDRLKHIASGVGVGRQAWKYHRPPRHSNRSGDRYSVESITGSGEFTRVPLPLAEMLQIAGETGIGSQRVCGAGQVRCEWSTF